MTDKKLHTNLDEWFDQHAPVKRQEPSEDAINAAIHFGVKDFISEWKDDVAIIAGVRVMFRQEQITWASEKRPTALVCRSSSEYINDSTASVEIFARTLRDEIAWINRPMVIHHILHGDWYENKANKQLVALNQYLRDGWKIIHIETDPTSTNDWRCYTLTRD